VSQPMSRHWHQSESIKNFHCPYRHRINRCRDMVTHRSSIA
jgi:hypothetical protein